MNPLFIQLMMLHQVLRSADGEQASALHRFILQSRLRLPKQFRKLQRQAATFSKNKA